MSDTIPLPEQRPWHDPGLAPEARAAALLAAMTPAERLKQLGSTWPGQGEGEGDGEVAPMQDSFDQAEPFAEAVRDGLGHLTRPFGTAPVRSEDGMRRLAGMQAAVVAANRFGIPAIAHEECLTGFTAWTATVYPTSLAWGATFDPELVAEMAGRIGRDMRAVGVHQGLAPVLDVVRDYRWGRVEETIGEDPVLVGAIGTAYVRGLQSAGIVATLKHFAGYSASRGARNHAPVSMGPRELADVVLPPFRRAVAAGARSVMNSYADLDGVPPAADEALLTGLLRERWGFTGTVVSDYWSLPFLQTMHHVAADAVDAGAQALTAGVDVELPHTLAFQAGLLDRRPHLAHLVDRAALRVLTQKAELGLLDPGWEPEPARAVDLDAPGNREVARRLAEESVVLLDNPRGLLPLAPSRQRIVVIGPVADDPGCLFGCYSFPNHVIPNHPGTALGVDAVTYLEAIRREYPDADVVHDPGTGILDGDAAGIERATRLAADADVVLLLVGDRSGMFGHGTSGEGCDVADLRLPGLQQDLVDAVLGTGREVVLVVSSGRPYAVGPSAARAAAALQVFFPGEEGGAALAGVLAGRVAPSGRLPVQIPSADAPQPGTYLAAPLALRSDGVSNLDPTPAYPFGHGLGYTEFTIGEVDADAVQMSVDGRVVVRATVANVGARAGTHVVQLYLSRPVASVVQPVRRLLGFQRVDLAPGGSRRIEFEVPAAATAFTGRDLLRAVEPGAVVLTVAASAADQGGSVDVDITGGSRRLLDADEHVSTAVTS